MPICPFCRRDTELKFLTPKALKPIAVHVDSGKLECVRPPETKIEPEKFRCVDGNVYEVSNERIGNFVATLRDMADVFLLNQDAEETSEQ